MIIVVRVLASSSPLYLILKATTTRSIPRNIAVIRNAAASTSIIVGSEMTSGSLEVVTVVVT